MEKVSKDSEIPKRDIICFIGHEKYEKGILQKDFLSREEKKTLIEIIKKQDAIEFYPDGIIHGIECVWIGEYLNIQKILEDEKGFELLLKANLNYFESLKEIPGVLINHRDNIQRNPSLMPIVFEVCTRYNIKLGWIFGDYPKRRKKELSGYLEIVREHQNYMKEIELMIGELSKYWEKSFFRSDGKKKKKIKKKIPELVNSHTASYPQDRQIFMREILSHEEDTLVDLIRNKTRDKNKYGKLSEKFSTYMRNVYYYHVEKSCFPNVAIFGPQFLEGNKSIIEMILPDSWKK